MTPASKAQWQIHLCVLLWGFTAIFGKLITLHALPLVWWRMLLVTGVLLLLPQVWNGLRGLPSRLRLAYAGVGVLVALHWLTFYASIKLANASVGATCMALATVFVAVIEPRLARRAFSWRELGLGLAVLPGVAMVVGGIPASMRIGVAMGALSALFVALFGSLNKRLVSHADPLTVTTLELGAGVLVLTALAPLLAVAAPSLSSVPWAAMPSPADGFYLLLLAFGCTLLPFALSLVALRHMSAFAAQLAVNLEPVYAILLAMLLLGEQRELGGWFYLGVLVILSAVVIHPLMHRGRRVVEASEALAIAESREVTIPRPGKNG